MIIRQQKFLTDRPPSVTICPRALLNLVLMPIGLVLGYFYSLLSPVTDGPSPQISMRIYAAQSFPGSSFVLLDIRLIMPVRRHRGFVGT